MTEESHPVIVDPATLALWRQQASVEGPERVQALECLLHVHRPRLLGLARRKVGVDWQSRIDPEDVLQEAYIAILNSASKFEDQGEDSFYHWSARIVDHAFIDQVRKLRRKKRDVTREVRPGAKDMSRHEALLDRCQRESATPSRFARKADALSAIMGGLALLPEHYREVIQRVYLNEEPIAEVAAEMGRTEDALRRLAGRAIDQLRAHLGRASQYLSQW